MHFFCRCIVALNPALPSSKMLVFVFLLAVLGATQHLMFAPQINSHSAWCAYAANVADKDLDIFVIGAVSLSCYDTPKIVNNICS
jgi:hypothetical protein